MTDELVERIAEVIYGTNPQSVIIPWEEVPNSRRSPFERAARSAIEEIESHTR